MNRVRAAACLLAGLAAVLILLTVAASPSWPDPSAKSSTTKTDITPAPAPPFQAHVDMQTFMEHVLTPAATIIWSVNGTIIDEHGEHDLSPRTDNDWERIVSGAATLAEATNALMIPERVRDAAWIGHVRRLADAADKAYLAAEAHDLKSISEVSDALDGICAACHRHYGVE
jgi:hypothetical protein